MTLRRCLIGLLLLHIVVDVATPWSGAFTLNADKSVVGISASQDREDPAQPAAQIRVADVARIEPVPLVPTVTLRRALSPTDGTRFLWSPPRRPEGARSAAEDH